ncbi:MAG: FliA/WhiG family RNA polymerase sigma factor [Armatimonadetes bacterium]|nr:FliA/WhiG family RNA polymerase sigma factor [Armatimonadota bacterium]
MISSEHSETAYLWKRFKEHGDADARTRLIEHYMYLAKVGAGRVHIPTGPVFSQDDLYGHAIVGLIDAVERFDLEMGRPFEAYALVRIRGAILDAVRSTDWLPRAVRNSENKLRQAMRRIEMSEGRSATDEELRDALGISQEELEELLTVMNASAIESLDAVISDIGDLNSSSNIADNMAYDPATHAQNSQVKRMLAEAIDSLVDNERTVIALYYFEDMTLKEIGQVLGFSESRACQIHTKAILKLQAKLSRWLDVMFMAA